MGKFYIFHIFIIQIVGVVNFVPVLFTMRAIVDVLLLFGEQSRSPSRGGLLWADGDRTTTSLNLSQCLLI